MDLYRFCFDEKEHLRLRAEIAKLSRFNWIYDNVARARELYSGAPGFYLATPTYVAAESGVRRQASELIVTNVRHLAVLQGDAAVSVAEEEPAVGLGSIKTAQC